MKVIKRDKTVEVFQVEKLLNAVTRAFESCGGEIPSDIAEKVISMYDESQDITVSVEEIQDAIEDLLIHAYPDTAKCYIIYRYNHKILRENRDKLMKDVTKKLMAADVQNQNANVDEHSFGGRMGEASRVVTKQYALDYCMSRKSRKNHMENMVYIHK